MKNHPLKKAKFLLSVLCVVLLILGCGMYFLHTGSAPAAGTSEVPGQTDAKPQLTITNLAVGKADAAVICYQDSVGIIDTATEDAYPVLDEWLSSHDITSVDYLILTHYDKDHIGGATALLDTYDVDAVYCPDYESEKQYYEGLTEVLSERENVHRVDDKISFSIDDVSVDIIPADDPEALLSGEKNRDNNMSLLTMVTYGENKFFFTGDVEKKRIKQILKSDHSIRADWIKMPHHNGMESNYEDFLAAVAPDYAVISTGAEQMPPEELTDLLDMLGIQTFTTIRENVTTTSNGMDITVSGSY